MIQLQQITRPGVEHHYCLQYARVDPTFFVIEVDEHGRPSCDAVEWWEPIPPLEGDLPKHESWKRHQTPPNTWINHVEVVGVVSERGRFGPRGDHVRRLYVKEVIRIEALPEWQSTFD
jgi:hypothetical protein